jgi:hypothetical protein
MENSQGYAGDVARTKSQKLPLTRLGTIGSLHPISYDVFAEAESSFFEPISPSRGINKLRRRHAPVRGRRNSRVRASLFRQGFKKPLRFDPPSWSLAAAEFFRLAASHGSMSCAVRSPDDCSQRGSSRVWCAWGACVEVPVRRGTDCRPARQGTISSVSRGRICRK